jgi:eukaryotic-like serine/threonine-protein kinase
MALAGAVLGGRYVLDQQIGNGGYGEVWHATDNVLSRPVAVKLLHSRYAQRSDALARFQTEARHAGSLSHENIAQVYDYGEPADGQPPYLVMELVDGPSLEAVLADGPLDTNRTMDIVAQAAAGLQAAHAAGMIHRDVKPGNLLLAPGGTVKITDFGIAHTIGSVPVTAVGELIGTPGYLAPERVAGEQATPACDVYSLGMVAYECLAGAPPFTGTSLVVALAQRDRPLPPLPRSVTADVGAFVLRLTAKDPASRLDSAAEVAVWAGLLRDGFGAGPAALHTWPGSSPGQPQSASRLPHRTFVAYACVAVAAVVVIALASVIGFASPRHRASARVSPPSATSRDGGVAARPPSRPGTSPARQPAVRLSPVAQQEPASDAPAVPAAKPSQAHGHGHGGAQGGADSNGNGQGNRNGNGNGNGQGHAVGS